MGVYDEKGKYLTKILLFLSVRGSDLRLDILDFLNYIIDRKKY